MSRITRSKFPLFLYMWEDRIEQCNVLQTLYCRPGQQIHANLFVLPEGLFLCKLICVCSCCAVSIGVCFVDICTQFCTCINEHKVKAVEL